MEGQDAPHVPGQLYLSLRWPFVDPGVDLKSSYRKFPLSPKILCVRDDEHFFSRAAQDGILGDR